ncbi:hypothetical protein HDV00_009208 [Rhizophlyctis rosea]|nr:hypothetical protein HDV00_009208 [Rhizophlyctis rosea]
MALNLASNVAEHVLGDEPTSTTPKYKARPGQQMKAIAWYGKEDLRLIEVPVPAVTDPADAVVRVTGSTICGSDLHLLHGDIMQLQKGDITGHEAMGIIEEIGPAVKNFKVGQKVVLAFNIGCGTCRYCIDGLYTMCETTNNSTVMEKLYGQKLGGIMGYGHFGGGFAGCQAEYVRMPFADTNLIAVPDDLPEERALYLSDIVCTAYHAVEQAGVKAGETVGIWGLGPVGLHVAQWLKLKGVSRIIGIDNVPYRLDLAKREWGVEPINFDVDKNVVGRVYELVPGGLDRAIDCAAFRYAKGVLHKVQRSVGLETDTSEIVNEEIQSVRKFGTIALIADYAGPCNGFLIGALMEKGINLIGCGQAPVQKYWHTILNLIQQEKFDPVKIVTHRFPFEEAVDVYKKFDAKEGQIIKVFLQTKFSPPASAGSPPLTSVKDL